MVTFFIEGTSLHWKPLRQISSVPLEVCRGYGGTPGVPGVWGDRLRLPAGRFCGILRIPRKITGKAAYVLVEV